MREGNLSLRKRKFRQDVKSFSSLIAAPVTGAVTLPAKARIAFRNAAGAAAGTTAATIVSATNRTIKTPLLEANEISVLDCVERGAVITPASGFDVLIDTGLGVFKKIAGA